ncbi:MAG TPA: glycosyltransferase family 39 protein [Terriglobales bacterium]|nr:glycosyltransferase family 39 protein [Terriglobales bacterium]
MLICTVMGGVSHDTGEARPRDGAGLRYNHAPARRYLLTALVAFVFRIEWMLIAGGYVLYRGDPFDPWLYGFEMGSVARSLIHGLGYSSPFSMFVGATGPTAWVPPLYPLIISSVIKLFGDFSVTSVLVLMGLNCAFSALTCIPIYLAAEATLGRRAAWLSAWTWALIPYFNRWHTWIWDVNLSALLMATMFWLTLRAAEDRSWRSEVQLGIVAGLAALGNPTLLIFLPISLLWILWRHRDNAAQPASTSSVRNRRTLRPVLVVFAMIAVIAAPWIVRNRLAFGKWVFVRTNFGTEFYLTNQHGLTPAQWITRHPSLNWNEGHDYRVTGELAYNRDRMHRAMQYIRDYPAEFAAVSMRRALAFWSGSIPTVFSDDALWRFRVYVPLSVLGLAGLAIMLARKKFALVLYLALLLLYPAVFYVTYPVPRQRHAIEPVLLMLACFAAVEFEAWIARRIRGSMGLDLDSQVVTRTAWCVVTLAVLICGVFAFYRARVRQIEAFSPQPSLTAERFTGLCGQPEQISTSGNVVELDYQKAQIRVRLIDQTYGWAFDRRSGGLIAPAQSLRCWKIR